MKRFDPTSAIVPSYDYLWTPFLESVFSCSDI